MVVLSFSRYEIERPLFIGDKTQTIRKSNPSRLRSMLRHGLQIYWKSRSKDKMKIGEAEVTHSFQISIDQSHNVYMHSFFDREMLPHSEVLDIAIKDGFKGIEEMLDCLYDMYGEDMYNIVFDVIRWEYLTFNQILRYPRS